MTNHEINARLNEIERQANAIIRHIPAGRGGTPEQEEMLEDLADEQEDLLEMLRDMRDRDINGFV